MSGLSDRAVEHLRQIADLPDLSGTKYELLSVLGRGGMGTVYTARDRELERLVALKVVTSPMPAGLADRLVREARVLAHLEHPGIVPVHDVGRLPDGRVFYVMKLVRGELLARQAGAETPLTDKLLICERICEAVAFAHSRGVIHRDLKPENIMIGPFGEVLVMDWEIAKLRDEAVPSRDAGAGTAVAGDGNGRTVGTTTAAGTVLGTPGYMAPEQARGDSSLTDERSDIYALGRILAFLLAGGRAGARPSLPRPLRAIVEKAVAPDPGDRYQQVSALASDLASFRAGLPVSAYPERIGDRALRFGSKYRLPLALVAAYIVMRAVLILLTER